MTPFNELCPSLRSELCWIFYEWSILYAICLVLSHHINVSVSLYYWIETQDLSLRKMWFFVVVVRHNTCVLVPPWCRTIFLKNSLHASSKHVSNETDQKHHKDRNKHARAFEMRWYTIFDLDPFFHFWSFFPQIKCPLLSLTTLSYTELSLR